jgi:predicted enzyme related to lactoylglutathione lyase
MPERTSYAPGTPSWVELASPDPDASARFYGALFGWDAEEAGPAEETGGYRMFRLGGRSVAGMMGIQGAGQPPAWSTYIATDDADGAAARAKDAGADLIVEPMDVMEAGRMAFLAHPAAGFVGVWQPRQHSGAQLVNEPNTFAWSQLHSRDVEGAKAFYRAVFGWTTHDEEMGAMTYTVVEVGDRGVAGMMPMPEQIPAEAPAFWLTFFAVDDCDATVARAEELGGTVRVPASDVAGVGRVAVLADAHGAAFGVIKGETPEE